MQFWKVHFLDLDFVLDFVLDFDLVFFIADISVRSSSSAIADSFCIIGSVSTVWLHSESRSFAKVR